MTKSRRLQATRAATGNSILLTNKNDTFVKKTFLATELTEDSEKIYLVIKPYLCALCVPTYTNLHLWQIPDFYDFIKNT